MTNQNLIIRMLGNDLPDLHGSEQTITNLDFTLKHEPIFENTDKIFALNRIVDKQKEETIIQILTKHNIKYFKIPYFKKEFDKLPRLSFSLDNLKKCDKNKKVRLLKQHNLYLINNNSCRNKCIEYGKEHNYTWTFVLDSNSFFTKPMFDNIIQNIHPQSEYIIIPQKRLADKQYTNDILLNDDCEKNIQSLKTQEPQIAFKNTSKYTFNPRIPYGLAPKAELLTALHVKGEWNKWMDFYGLPINVRQFENCKCQTLSYIVRLNPQNTSNKFKGNWSKRWYGIYLLSKQITSST